MPGYRPGVFRRRYHYRPKRRVAIRAIASVVGEECRFSFAGEDRANLVFVGVTNPDYLSESAAPLAFVGIPCREDA